MSVLAPSHMDASYSLMAPFTAFAVLLAAPDDDGHTCMRILRCGEDHKLVWENFDSSHCAWAACTQSNAPSVFQITKDDKGCSSVLGCEKMRHYNFCYFGEALKDDVKAMTDNKQVCCYTPICNAAHGDFMMNSEGDQMRVAEIVSKIPGMNLKKRAWHTLCASKDAGMLRSSQTADAHAVTVVEGAEVHCIRAMSNDCNDRKGDQLYIAAFSDDGATWMSGVDSGDMCMRKIAMMSADDVVKRFQDSSTTANFEMASQCMQYCQVHDENFTVFPLDRLSHTNKAYMIDSQDKVKSVCAKRAMDRGSLKYCKADQFMHVYGIAKNSSDYHLSWCSADTCALSSKQIKFLCSKECRSCNAMDVQNKLFACIKGH